MRTRIIMNKKTDVTVEEAFNMFIRKATVKNLSNNTLKTYKWHYDAFSRYIDVRKNIATITENEIDGFIIYLRGQCDTNDASICSYLRTIRAFLYYCMDCGYLNRFKIKMPKVEKKIKETYTDEELMRLLKKPDINKCSFTEYKTWVFENYLLATGNRISSALNVKISDIGFDEGTIIIRKVKNRKQQIIPLSKTLEEILKEYLAIRGGEKEDYLFCNIYGEQGSRRMYQELVREYNIRRNVNKTSSHLFRHTFAKKWILAGGDIFRLQKILGHSDLSITREYVQMFGDDLQMDFEKFNPLDNMQIGKKRIEMR